MRRGSIVLGVGVVEGQVAEPYGGVRVKWPPHDLAGVLQDEEEEFFVFDVGDFRLVDVEGVNRDLTFAVVHCVFDVFFTAAHDVGTALHEDETGGWIHSFEVTHLEATFFVVLKSGFGTVFANEVDVASSSTSGEK